MTYARRYSLALACGVGSDEDNDALLVQEEYKAKELSEDINQNMKKYELWKSPTQTTVIIGSENFCKELQHFLKGKTDAEKNAIAEANKVQITDVLLDVAADKSIGETKRNNRIKFLDQVMLNVNPA